MPIVELHCSVLKKRKMLGVSNGIRESFSIKYFTSQTNPFTHSSQPFIIIFHSFTNHSNMHGIIMLSMLDDGVWEWNFKSFFVFSSKLCEPHCRMHFRFPKCIKYLMNLILITQGMVESAKWFQNKSSPSESCLYMKNLYCAFWLRFLKFLHPLKIWVKNFNPELIAKV